MKLTPLGTACFAAAALIAALPLTASPETQKRCCPFRPHRGGGCWYPAPPPVVVVVEPSQEKAAAEPLPISREEQIQIVTKRAIEFLKASRTGDHWEHPSVPEHSIGLTALCTIALMEAGVSRNDPIIMAAAKYVRDSLGTLNGNRAPNTYSLSLAMILLDKIYEDSKINAIIKSLAVRITVGQNQQLGGWSYNCPEPTKPDENKWLKFLQDNENKSLPEDRPSGLFQPGSGLADNSNTYFAILGLWIAHRHGVPVNYPLFLAERRFRKTQSADGGWSYDGGSVPGPTTASMTTAGLLGLALAYTASEECGVAIVGYRERFNRDPQVLRAKQYLGDAIKNGSPRTIYDFHFFLWGLERVCVMYGWENDLDGVDWYKWGTDWLLKTQANDGSWNSEGSGAIANTAYSLLFLGKAQLLSNGRKNAPLRPMPSRDSNYQVDDWQERMAAARKLADVVVNGSVLLQAKALDKLRDTPGKENTLAIVEAIKQITGPDWKNQVRDALAKRLTRQTAPSVQMYLQSDEQELNAAAAWAAAIRDPPHKQLIPDVIPLLSHKDEFVSTRAYEALKVLTGEDFGKSPEKWGEWWQKTGKTQN